MGKLSRKKFKELFTLVIEGLEGRDYALDNFGRYYDTCRIIGKYVSSGSNFLAVGIYPGHLALIMQKLFGLSLTGISTTTTELFMRLMKEHSVEIFSTDIEKHKLPFGDGSFEVVLAAELIEHLYNPHNLVSEVWRVLSPGGFFVVTTPNLARLKNRVRFFFSGKPVMEHLHGNINVFETNDWTHKREYTYHEIFKMMEAVGIIPEEKRDTSLSHFPSSFKVRMKNLVKNIVYLSPNWKGGLICIGRKP